MSNRNIVIFPFAYKGGAKSGANLKKNDDPLTIYLKNAIVATVSCKRNNLSGGIDVALITNIEIAEEYRQVFYDNEVKIIYCPFDSFKFPDDYQWCLAFYKLCALKYIATSDYENVLCLDTDTYIRGNFDYLWKNLKQNIILYDRSGSTVEPYGSLAELEFVRFMYKNRIQKVGGEFLASSIENLKPFIEKAESIYKTILKDDITIKSGDEYITSLTAGCFNNIDFSGERYIFRFETGFCRQVCNKGQLSVTPILHVYGAKRDGMIKMYNFFIRNKCFPTERTIYKWFHFYHRRFKHFIQAIIKGTLFN